MRSFEHPNILMCDPSRGCNYSQTVYSITGTIRKWPGDCYIQGDSYISVSFKLYWKLMNNVFM